MSEARDWTFEKVEGIATAQVTTDAYAGIPESHLKSLGKNRIDYFVVNEDAANAITAKIVGRFTQADGSASAWQDVIAGVSIAGGGTLFNHFVLTELVYDEYAVQVKATVGASQGDANVYGGARLLEAGPTGLVAAAGATMGRTIAAESTDTITTSLQSSKAETQNLHVTGYTGIQAAVGDMVEAADAALTMSDGTNGTTLQGDDTADALFQTDSAGQLDVIATDVAGASSLEFILVVREGTKSGAILDIFVLSFDGA